MTAEFFPYMTPPAWTFHIMTFGCKVNQYESQALREAWCALGGVEVPRAEAQVTVVNSCAITARAERETRNALYRLARENPQGQRILTGCSAHLVGPALQNTAQDSVQLVHAVIGAPQKSVLLEGPWSVLRGDHNTMQAGLYPPFSIAHYHRTRPVIKVQDGCSHRCTYCIVPVARGSATSRAPHQVVEEARRLLGAGHREIMLSGINLAQYGRNCPDYGDFWDLLTLLDRELAPEWAGVARFRISSLEPGQLNTRGIETLSRCAMLCPHLHISLQSGSDTVLRRMGRGHYTARQLVDAIQLLQQHWPRMGLGADILTGFPGEKAEHLTETLEVVDALPLTYAHVFPYSRRPQTPATDFAEQVPHHEKLRRAASIRAAVEKKQDAFLHELLTLDVSHVVLDGAKGCKGVNEFYTQCRLVSPRGSTTKKVSREGIVRAKPVAVDKAALVVELARHSSSPRLSP
ncbi:MAG: MiaB/RimO family radical SAM methylthiotransferase [Desulfovibrionaceae bacterium]